jgi:hypothetical protein
MKVVFTTKFHGERKGNTQKSQIEAGDTTMGYGG